MKSKFLALGLAALLSACALADPDKEEQVPLGDFRLSHNVSVTKNAQKIGPSRTATPEEWETVMEAAIEKRFGRYEGEKLYHIAINLDGYALAIPGIPLVVSPKSVMVISLTIWDDAAQAKLNPEPRQLTIFEQVDGDTIIGSGLTQTRETQMSNLAAQMAKAVERYMVANSVWFGENPTEEDIAAAETDVLVLPEGAVPPATPAGETVPATN